MDLTLESSAIASSGLGKKRKRTEECGHSTNTLSRHSSQQSTASELRCWFCGAKPAQIAHVIGQEDNGFEDLVAEGLLSFPSIANPENGIPLCPTCHCNFDNLNQPGLIFIPTNIEYFIEYEKNDQRRRRETRARIQQGDRSSYVGRRVPSPIEYLFNEGGLYTRYYLRQCFPEAMVASIGEFGEPKCWYGAPSAALRRAQLLLGNTLLKGLPRDVRRKLNELTSLYQDFDLETDLGQGYEQGTEWAGSTELDGSKATTMNLVRCPPSTSRPGGQVNRSNGAVESGGVENEKGLSESHKEKDHHAGAIFGVDDGGHGGEACGCVEESNELDSSATIASSDVPWKWGPQITSQNIIEFVIRREASARVRRLGAMLQATSNFTSS